MRITGRTTIAICAALALPGLGVVGPAAQESAASSCRDAFIELVAAGNVVSIDGLAIEPGWSGYWRTAWVPGQEGERARLERAECADGVWEAPAASFPGARFSDYHPSVSPDGSRLYFTSTRPPSGAGPAVRQNGWFASLPLAGRGESPAGRAGHGAPQPLPGTFFRAWDGHPIELPDGSLLFASDRPGGRGRVDFYRLEGVDDGMPVVVPELSSSSSDNDPAFEPGAGLLVFARHDDRSGDIDLWITRRGADGWELPAPIAAVNTREWEASPAFTPEGDLLLFRRGDGPFLAVDVDELAPWLAR